MTCSPRSKRKGFTENTLQQVEVEELMENGNKNEVLNDGLGKRWKFWKRRRYIVVLMAFLGNINKAIIHANLSIAIFPMTENYTVIDYNGTEMQVQDFDWDSKTRGFLLSVFFYGSCATFLPAGLLAVKYGGGKLFGLGILAAAILTISIPVAARIHLYLLVAVRVLEGMWEGMLAPCLELLLSRWIPVQGRSTSMGLATSGKFVGNIAGNAVSSAIGYYCGWEAIFYCTGGVGVLWFVSWVILVKEDPILDRRVMPTERQYIQISCGKRPTKEKLSSIPYIKILKSLPVWAITLSNICNSWVFAIFATQTPAFIKDVLELDYQTSGYITAVTYAVCLLTTYITCPIADYLTSKNMLTRTAARKMYICGGFLIMAVFAFVIQKVTSTFLVAVSLAVIISCIGIIHIQFQVNILDLAPRYSSVLAGLHSIGLPLTGMIAPTVTGYLTQNKTLEEWQMVFSIQSGICLLGAFVYGIFGSGVLQSWAGHRNLENCNTEAVD